MKICGLLGGSVNAYYTHTNYSGALAPAAAGITHSANVVQTGLLPSAIGFGGKTRQNDLDLAFQFTFFVGADSGTGAGAGNNSLNIRQAYGSFGDKSWGTIKYGRDLGIFGSDAILSDMTLLGVGVGGSSTLGRIGSGYMYADWVGQISYASPNWNGFSFAAGLREPWSNNLGAGGSNQAIRNEMGYEGEVSYEWAGDYAGKAWLSGISQKHSIDTGSAADYTSNGVDIGAKINVAGFGLVGYYYDGRGLSGTANQLSDIMFASGNLATGKTDDNGGYVQATYTIPSVGTKLGLSWGESNSKDNVAGHSEFKNESWVVGAYHPLTKSLNLVAEYTDNKLDNINWTTANNGKARTLALGAIMFF